jgi:excisionase family DNA binding protein
MRGPKAPEAPRYITLAEASSVCSTPAETLRKWVQVGKLRGYRPGKALLLREDELRAFVESRDTQRLRAKGGG